MSGKEKQVAQIFERTKWIIEQARQQCLLWEHHLSPKLILNGILPPPWLSSNSLPIPNELNKDDIVSEVLFSQPQFGVSFSARHCSLYSNLGAVSEDVLCPSGIQNEVHALRKDCNTGDGHSNLPDCSVNNDGCASSGPQELDSCAISPQNQIEPRVSDSYHDPALSLAKLQRSKPRQRALELRNSAKAPKCWSGDDNNTGICAGAVRGSAPSSLQAEHIEQPDLVKDFHSNIQGCSTEEVSRGDCQTQTNEKYNYSGRITRSKSLALQLKSSNVASSSVVKKDGPPSNNSNEPLELVNGPLFTNESCEVKEANRGEHQRKEAGSRAYHKRTTKSRSSRQSRYNSEILKLDSTSGRGKGVEIHDFMQPFAPVELTDLSKASDQSNGSRRNTVKDGDFCNNKEGNSRGRREPLRNSSPSPVDDNLMTSGFVNSISKSVQSPQPLISQHSQDRAVSVVGCFRSQKDQDFCAVKAKERLSRSGIGKVYITTDSKSQNHIEEISRSLSSNFCEQSATCSEFGGKRSQNVQLAELDARRLSSTRKDSKLDAEIAMNSAEKENTVVSASRNTRAVTACATDGSLRPVSASNLDGGSLLGKSLHIETAAADKALDAQENILSGANPTDNIVDISAATVAEVDADLDGIVERDPSCLGSRVTSVSPKVGMDVSALRMPSVAVMSVMPMQLDFDDIEESSMNGISSPDMKEGQQGMSPEEEPLNLLEPVNVLEGGTSLERQVKCNSSGEMCLLETEEAPIREGGPQLEYFASRFEQADVARKAIKARSPNKELPLVQKELCILTSSLMNHSSPSQVAGEISSGILSKEVMASKFVSVSRENDESSAKVGDALSAAVTGNGLHKYTDETVSNFTVGFLSGALIDEVNVEARNSISLCQNVDLLRQKWLSDDKNTGFSADFEIFNSSKESFGHDVKHSCSQHKRRKIEIETGKCLPATSNFPEKPLDSIDKRSISRGLNIEDNPEALRGDQHLTSDQEDDIGRPYVSNSPTEEMHGTQQCETMERSSLKVRKEEKLIADGRDRSADKLLLENEKVDSWHHQVNGGQESAQRLTYVENSNLNGRIYPGGNAEFSCGSSVSQGIQCVDLIGTDDTVPEFEGFIMATDSTQPCTTGDQMELEKMNLRSNSVDYSSLGKSRLLHSPLCYSSTPYKLHTIPGLYLSLPNGLLEGMNLRTSLPPNDGNTRSLSDCLPNRNVQYTPSVQTLWDRINLNFGSSGKRQSKLELPCISEENENVDEIPDTFQKGIGSEGMTSSITREPLAEIIDNANPCASALQDDILTQGSADFVNTEFNFSGTHNKVKRKLYKQDGDRRRFTNKGKENQSMSLGANGAKKNTESVCNRPSRPKLSGKDSLKQQGSTFSVGKKSSYNNIVSNVASFVPLVQQKQAAAVVTGKRDIKVKALEAAEAAKRMAEKKENERKMKKEALRLERERLEQQNLRQLELQKKKKEEERKKKEAEMAAKKRQREEEEKKEKERKRKRVNDAKKQQQEHEKVYAKKEEIHIQSRAAGEEVQGSKKLMDERENHQNVQLQDIREGNVEQISETAPLNTRYSTNDKTKESCPAYSEAVSDGANKGKVMGNLIKAAEDNDLINENSLQEQSYDISPYKGSDDEDEDEDDIPNNKFIPSWASKHRLSLAVSSQKMDPETIFPPQSFCNIAEVLLPRRLQLK